MRHSTGAQAGNQAFRSMPEAGILSDDALDRMEKLLDQQFGLAGFRFGLDGLVGLVPVVGDVATAGVSGLIIVDAWKKGVRKRTLGRMAINTVADMVVGSIPLVGDILDFAIRSNVKNIRLMRSDLAKQNRSAG
ncbi:MAG: DUF4112 domain-containing protein [Pseudomonadota bacterium]